MKRIIEVNYSSIVDRGLITDQTMLDDFIMKIEEEVQEFIDAAKLFGIEDKRAKEELSDIILTCLNTARHYDINIQEELWMKIGKNIGRIKS